MYYYKSPLGTLRIASKSGAITEIIWDDGAMQPCEPSPIELEAGAQLDRYFAGAVRQFEIALDFSSCTPFQHSVLTALMNIPYGQQRSYRQIAIEVGRARAARAVGLACRLNPLQIVIPCHRVIATSGRLTGYAGGLDAKSALLKLESALI